MTGKQNKYIFLFISMRTHFQRNRLSSIFLRPHKKRKISTLENIKNRFSLIEQLLFSVIKITFFLMFLVFLVILYKEVSRTEIILDPLNMPQELVKLGYSGTIVSEKLLDEARKIEFETNKTNNEFFSRADSEPFNYIDKLSADIQFSDIQLPGANFTFRTLVRYLRQILGLKTTYLHGDVIKTDNGLILTLRNISEIGIPYVRLTTSETLDNLIQNNGGEALLKISNPSILAIQAYQRFVLKKNVSSDQAEANFRSLKEIIDYCIKYAPSSDDALAYTLLADALSINNQEQAILHYQHAIKIDPHYIDAYIGLIYTFGALERQEDARVQFNKAIELDPNNIGAYLNWGFALVNLNQYEEAIEQYKKATELDPSDIRAYLNWGFALNRLNQHTKAIEQFKKASELKPDNAIAHLDWGFSHAKLNQPEKAIEQFKKASELDPDNARVYQNWGSALNSLSRFNEAIVQFRKAIELHPYYARAYFSWGYALNKLKCYEEAIEKFKKASELDPDIAIIYFYWGNVLGTLNRHKEAIVQFEKASKKTSKLDRSNANIHYNWGLALDKLNDHDEAEIHYKKAAEYDPFFSYKIFNDRNLVIQ